MARLSLMVISIACVVSAALAGSSHTPSVRRDSHDRMIRVRARSYEAAPVPDGGRDWKLAKRFSNARFTNYATGQGACGGVNKDSDFIVALNEDQYGTGEDCYKMITISYNGKSTQAQIVDECPGCPYGGLDLSPGLFSYFADIGEGQIFGTWEFSDGSGASSSSSTEAPTTTWSSSTPAWTPPPTTSSTHHTTSTSSSTWTTSWSSSSSTWSSSSSSSSTSSTSSSSSSSWSTSSAPSPTAPAGETPEDSFIEAVNYAVMQIGGLFAGAAQVNLQTADS